MPIVEYTADKKSVILYLSIIIFSCYHKNKYYNNETFYKYIRKRTLKFFI